MLLAVCFSRYSFANSISYKIVDTEQIRCYGNTTEIEYPKAGAAFFGQDAQYNGNHPAYKNNGDGFLSEDEAPQGPHPDISRRNKRP